MASNAITETVLLDFLSTYVDDVENGTPRSRAEYCSLYPEHAATIAEEFDALESATGSNHGTVLPRVPEVIGPFRIRSRLGRGGQGTVYLAEDTRLQRDVALKIVPSVTPLGGHLLSARVHREAVLASQIEHAGICKIHEIGDALPFCYIAMQWIDGEPLSLRISAERAGRSAKAPELLSGDGSSRSCWHAVAHYVERAARAIHHCHEAGILHRDLKPANLMVNKLGRPVLLDFGLARSVDNTDPVITQRNEVLGTPAYSSPEQVLAKGSIDRRTDVWSLGIVLYECLTLEKPFEAPTTTELHEAIRREEPLDPRRHDRRVPIDLVRIVLKAIEKDPDSRYRTAEEFGDDLRRYRRNEPVLARAVGARVRFGRWAQRNPALAGLVVVAILLVATTLVGAAVFLHREADLREQAQVEHRQAHRLAQSFLFDADNALGQLHNSTAARQAVIEQSMAYLENVRQRLPRDPVVRCDLSEAHLRLGTVLGNAKTFNLGRPGAALKQYESGLTLAALDGEEDAVQRRALESVGSRLHKRIADLHYSEQRFEQSLGHYQQARILLGNLVDACDLVFVVMLELNHGNALIRVGQIAASEQLFDACRQRIADAESLQGTTPAVLDAWSRWHEVHAGQLEQSDNFAGAVESFAATLRYGELALQADPDQKGAQQRVASAARALARLHTRFGRESRGLRYFTQARDMLARLHEQNPGDHLCASSHFTAEAELAAFHLLRGDVRVARTLMTEAIAIGRELTEQFPGSVNLAEKLCSAEATLGDILMRVGERAEAVDLLRGLHARAAARHDRDDSGSGGQSRLALTESKLGQALLVSGARDEAIALLRTAVTRYEALLGRGISPTMHGTGVAFTKRELANALRGQDPAGSERLYRESLAHLEQLEQQRDGDETPRERVELMAGVHLRLGQIYDSNKRWQAAETSYASSVAIVKQRLSRHPHDYAARVVLARHLHVHARCLERQGRPGEAAAMRAESLAVWDTVIARFPNNSAHAYWAGMVSWCRGRNLASAGVVSAIDVTAAHSCYQRAVEHWQPLHDSGYVPGGSTAATFAKNYALLRADLGTND